jgi:hypothetical protein
VSRAMLVGDTGPLNGSRLSSTLASPPAECHPARPVYRNCVPGGRNPAEVKRLALASVLP